MEVAQYSTADQIYPVATDGALSQDQLLTLYPASGGGGGLVPLTTTTVNNPAPSVLYASAPDPTTYTDTQSLFSPSPTPAPVQSSDVLQTPAEQLIQQTGTTSTNDTADYIDAILQFKDKVTKQDVAVSGQLIDQATGDVLSTITDSFEANIQMAGVPPKQLRVVFSAPGYKVVNVTLDTLLVVPNPIQVYFEKSGVKLPWLEIAALFALIAFARKKKKEVGAVTFDDVKPWLYIGGGLLAFSVVKKTLEALGIWKSPATKAIDQAVNDPNSFWNPNFWTTVKPAGAAWSFAWTWDQAAAVAKTIYDAFGYFGDEASTVKGAFRQCKTQANASYLCYVFYQTYQQDMLDYLRNGKGVAFWNGLSDSDIEEINNYINGLIKY